MALGSVRLSLYVYDGLVGSYTASDLKYTINKNVIIGEENVVLEIAELTRDFLTVSFNDDYISYTKWSTAIVEYFDENQTPFTFSNPQTFNFLAFDAYGYFEEGANPILSTDSLISSTEVYHLEDTAGKFPIYAEGVGKVVIDSTTTQITDNGNTNQKIQYLNIPANSSQIKIYALDDSTLLKTIKITNICEPKFTPYKVTFLNRLGSLQDIFFFKKTTETMSVTDETFKRNIINPGAPTYLTNEAQQNRYNVNAKTQIKLNTGFISENMNQTIEELFLSENVWIRYESQTLPILPVTKEMTFKTSLNDNLIDYTIQFDFAFNKINNIR
jgi:hypothetical protein|tara:strand:+ start:186 stop:1172 length:987 start_codon:yes stop_codon:yes gene_type:complete